MIGFAAVCAMILDAIFGEPRVLWSRLSHPAVLIGRVIGWADRHANHAPAQRLKGVALTVALVVGAGTLGLLLTALPGIIAEIAVGAIFLAQRSLADHVSSVADGLRLSLGDGRLAVSNIVGRDTRGMDEAAVTRAAIESAAENFSDGVTAPFFWFVLAGLPGLLIYKAINTADSMIGYLTPRHAAFGWAAARLDDLLNWVPARLTALLMIPLGGGPWRSVARDARQHRSPNAGWPEAAMARALNVALAGPRSYDGRLQNYAFVHPAGARDVGVDDINRAVVMLWKIWGILLGVTVIVALLT